MWTLKIPDTVNMGNGFGNAIYTIRWNGTKFDSNNEWRIVGQVQEMFERVNATVKCIYVDREPVDVDEGRPLTGCGFARFILMGTVQELATAQRFVMETMGSRFRFVPSNLEIILPDSDTRHQMPKLGEPHYEYALRKYKRAGAESDDREVDLVMKWANLDYWPIGHARWFQNPLRVKKVAEKNERIGVGGFGMNSGESWSDPAWNNFGGASQSANRPRTSDSYHSRQRREDRGAQLSRAMYGSSSSSDNRRGRANSVGDREIENERRFRERTRERRKN